MIGSRAKRVEGNLGWWVGDGETLGHDAVHASLGELTE